RDLPGLASRARASGLAIDFQSERTRPGRRTFRPDACPAVRRSGMLERLQPHAQQPHRSIDFEAVQQLLRNGADDCRGAGGLVDRSRTREGSKRSQPDLEPDRTATVAARGQTAAKVVDEPRKRRSQDDGVDYVLRKRRLTAFGLGLAFHFHLTIVAAV